MNVSFSTRGWQDKPWETWLDWAETMRFGGIELYNVQNCPQLTDRGGARHKYATAASGCARKISASPASTRRAI